MFRLDRTKEDKIKFGKIGGGGVFMLVKQCLDFETKLVKLNTASPILSIEIKFKGPTRRFALVHFIGMDIQP